VKNLTTRLAVLLMLALMLITGGYDYVRLARERDRLVNVSQTDTRIFAETLALAVRRNLRRGRTTEELAELLDEIGSRPGLVWVAIFDPKGEIVATGVGEGAAPPSGDDDIRRTLATGRPASTLMGTGKDQILRYVEPFRWPNGRTAAVEVRHSLADVQRNFSAAVHERIVARIVILVCFVLAIVAVTRWSVARPIEALIRGARAVGSGDLTQRIAVQRANELGALALEFNRMAENLQRAHTALLEQSEERLRLEREVQQTQKLAAVGMLAAEVAHEVGTPLNVVAGRAEALERVIPRDHPERRHLDVIAQQTGRIASIIRSLLDYTRPRRAELRREAVPPILARVVTVLESRYRSKGARILVDLPEGLPTVMADADLLQQLFINLLGNALDASPSGGTVAVIAGSSEALLPEPGRAEVARGKAQGPSLEVHIVDRGSGMTAAELAHVFEPFFSTKKRGQGTGLGLPIVEEIIRAHRGEVTVRSAPGSGTEVIVRLPLAAEERAAAVPSAETATSVVDAG